MAVTLAPARMSCAVLPPGAAQRSATPSPLISPSKRAGKLAAVSCTHQAPSLKPGNSVTAAVSFSNRTEPVGNTTPPRRSAHISGLDFTVMATGASRRCAARMERASSGPYASINFERNHSGASSVAANVLASSVSLARTKARSRALTSPENRTVRGSDFACVTARSTAALSGMSRNRTCAAATCSM